ncbi:WD repeat-containing protein 55 homolog isoform X2 [Palaemon carinicauda]|uniref:WD repeat-containing protein 55 homolog isoform X2 n=1 Tax=Palaemon carinicauda TaxID=392227 RepID=UPI0035B5FB4C
MVWFPEACTLCYDLSTVLLNDDADEDALRAAKSSLRPWVSGFGRDAPTGCPYILDGDMASSLFPGSSSAAVPSALAAPMIEALRATIPLEEDNQLSGDVSALDINVEPMDEQSEMYESELTAMTIVRDDSRLVVGSGQGVMFIFKWGDFSFHIDRYAGHPGQINCLVPIGDRMLVTRCKDGNIRAVHLYAHRFVGIVGQHKRFGVENISVSWHDGIRFWNISYLYDVEVDGTLKGHKKHDKGFNLESSKRRNRCDFFSDVPENMESDD